MREQEKLFSMEKERNDALQRQIRALEMQAERLEMDRLNNTNGNQYNGGGQGNNAQAAILQQNLKDKQMEYSMQ